MDHVDCTLISNNVARKYAQPCITDQFPERMFQVASTEVKDVVLRLCSEGVIPTQKRVALLLPRPGILRDLKIRKYLREISQELKKDNENF